MEMKAIKTMGAMEEGDAAFGAGAKVNLDAAFTVDPEGPMVIMLGPYITHHKLHQNFQIIC